MNKTLSFSQVVKEELATNKYESEGRLKALLSAFVRINGHISFKNKKSQIILKTQNAKIAKFIYTTIKSFYDKNVELSYTQQTNLKKNTNYQIVIYDEDDSFINDLDIQFLEGKISKNIVYNDNTIAGYLAGAFLASGSVSNPATSSYHLEISLDSENFAKWMLHLFQRHKYIDIAPKIAKRRDKYIVYFKKGDQIAEFLVMIGAVTSCLEFENIRIDRDYANSSNRLENFDMANMRRTLETSKEQIQMINYIDEVLGVQNIRNKKTQLLCRLRIQNESASLSDLARIMSEELGEEVSRSNINHMFRYLKSLYERLTNK